MQRMATPHPDPVQRLVEILDTLPATDRQEITAWLLRLGQPAATAIHPGFPQAGEIRSRLAAVLPTGEGSQLVTIRLPAERHAQLRAWCSGHGFSMAAVVRGLVERFLEEEGRATPAG